MVGAAEGQFLDGGAPAVEVSISASRTSGVAPLGVFFEAVVTNAGVDYPFHELLYEWDFGASVTGSFAYGNTLYNAKRYATGPLAACVFDEAGFPGTVHTVTLTVKRRTGGVTTTIGTATETITTSSSITEFDVAGKLLLINQSGTVGTNPFSNADTRQVAGTYTRAALAADIAAGYRAILFRGNETHTFEGQMNFSASDGPFLLGAYDTGTAKPTLTSADASYTLHYGTDGNDDARVVGVIIENTGGGDGLRVTADVDNLLVLNNDFGDVDGNCMQSWWSNHTTNGLPNYAFVHGNTTGNGTTQGSSCLRWGYNYNSVQGNDLDGGDITGTGTHVWRDSGTYKGVYAHNTLTGPDLADGPTGRIYKAQGFSPGEMTGDPTHGEILIQDNLIVGYTTEWFDIGRGDSPDAEKLRDFILERNFFSVPASVADLTPNLQRAIKVFGADTQRVTIRNNVGLVPASADSPLVELIQLSTALSGTLDSIWICNNSYSDENSPTGAFINVDAGTNVYCSNNLGSHDGANAPDAVSGTVAGDSNNVYVSDNPFSTNPPTAITHFRLGSGASEIDGGGEVAGLFDDYERVAIDGGVNIGAMQTDP